MQKYSVNNYTSKKDTNKIEILKDILKNNKEEKYIVDKKVENLSIKDYDQVGDIIGELLKEQFEVEEYSFDNLDKDVEYVTGTINIVKIGEKPDSLKHTYHSGEWSEDILVTDSYRYATYYRLDKLNKLCETTLSGSWSETYNFNELLNKL